MTQTLNSTYKGGGLGIGVNLPGEGISNTNEHRCEKDKDGSHLDMIAGTESDWNPYKRCCNKLPHSHTHAHTPTHTHKRQRKNSSAQNSLKLWLMPASRPTSFINYWNHPFKNRTEPTLAALKTQTHTSERVRSPFVGFLDLPTPNSACPEPLPAIGCIDSSVNCLGLFSCGVCFVALQCESVC
jgi:hypothetical protein